MAARCPACRGKRTQVEEVRDSQGNLIETRQVCHDCGNVWNVHPK